MLTIWEPIGGKFSIDDAITLDELKEIQNTQKVTDLFSDLKVIEGNETVAKKLVNGVSVTLSELGETLGESEEFFIGYKNKTIGMYKRQGDKLATIVYLFED